MRESSVPEALLSIRDAIENDRYIGISADLINLGALKQLYQDSREKPAPPQSSPASRPRSLPAIIAGWFTLESQRSGEMADMQTGA